MTRTDKKKWWDKKMTELEEDMKCNRQGDFFKKLKRLSGTRGTLADTILDKAGQQLKTSEEKLARWKRHFEHSLNGRMQDLYHSIKRIAAKKICDNYHRVALLSVPDKMLALIFLERLQTIIEPQLLEAQCGFQKEPVGPHCNLEGIWSGSGTGWPRPGTVCGNLVPGEGRWECVP